MRLVRRQCDRGTVVRLRFGTAAEAAQGIAQRDQAQRTGRIGSQEGATARDVTSGAIVKIP